MDVSVDCCSIPWWAVVVLLFRQQGSSLTSFHLCSAASCWLCWLPICIFSKAAGSAGFASSFEQFTRIQYGQRFRAGQGPEHRALSG